MITKITISKRFEEEKDHPTYSEMSIEEWMDFIAEDPGGFFDGCTWETEKEA